MAEQVEIVLIRPNLDATGVIDIVNSIGQSDATAIDQRVYYPYFWFSATCSVSTLVGKKPVSAVCLVDGCSELGATADPFECSRMSVPVESVIDLSIDEAQSRKSARRFLTHNLGRRFRTIGNFDTATNFHGVVYKAFWIAHCGDAMVMVDSVTSAIHVLRGERPARSGPSTRIESIGVATG